MRKIKLLGLSLFLGLILTGGSAFAQGGIGIIGEMSGRITNPSGNGVGGAGISVVPIGACFSWQGNSTRTNPFGYYRIYVHYDCVLLVTTAGKGMRFTPNSMIIPLDSNYENIDFIANRTSE